MVQSTQTRNCAWFPSVICYNFCFVCPFTVSAEFCRAFLVFSSDLIDYYFILFRGSETWKYRGSWWKNQKKRWALFSPSSSKYGPHRHRFPYKIYTFQLSSTKTDSWTRSRRYTVNVIESLWAWNSLLMTPARDRVGAVPICSCLMATLRRSSRMRIITYSS